MKQLRVILLMIVAVLAIRAGGQENSPLSLMATTPLPGFSGDLDHFAVDLKGNRLFMAAEDHKSVEVFDLRSGKSIHSISGFVAPHSMVFLPGSNHLIVADGDETTGKVELVNGKDYSITDSITLPAGADGAVYNPVNKYFYVESGSDDPKMTSHQISIIDTRKFKLAGGFALPGPHSNAMAIDHAGKKLYVNLFGPGGVGMVDLDTHQVVATWPTPGSVSGTSLALDESKHRLFIVTRKPAEFHVFNMDTGKVMATLPSSELNDDMWFDSANKRIYATGTNATTVIKQVDADHYEKLEDVQTAYRARTSILVPELGKLYLAESGKGKPDAPLALKIYQVQP